MPAKSNTSALSRQDIGKDTPQHRPGHRSTTDQDTAKTTDQDTARTTDQDTARTTDQDTARTTDRDTAEASSGIPPRYRPGNRSDTGQDTAEQKAQKGGKGADRREERRYFRSARM